MTPVQKVAFATNDGTDINRHFGRLSGFVVITISEGRPSERTVVPRPGNADRPGGGHDHDALLDPISDCTTLIAGGMGRPMADHVEARGLQLILTSLPTIDEALGRYLAGSLEHESRRAHAPHH
jgi:predicted Fe-Mo cluster-binding NifX family protein